MAKISYTEQSMGDAFERRLLSRTTLSGLGRFTRVFREVDCQRGRPDFVGIAFTKRCPSLLKHDVTGFATATVLSLLKPSSARRLDYLVRQSGFSRETVTSAVRTLLAQEFIEQQDTDRYILSRSRNLFGLDVTAFELKLSHPRRALFQAQQYTLFAHRVVIVVPPTQIGGFQSHLASLRRWGIGLAAFDLLTRQFRLTIPPQRANPASRQHQAYALLRLVSGDVP